LKLNLLVPISSFLRCALEQGDTAKAIAQIKATLQWRIDFGVDIIVDCFAAEGTSRDSDAHQEMRKILSQENVAAKIYVRGYDRHGRALMYMTPARENTRHELNNMRHLVYNLEKAIRCTARQSQVCRATGNDVNTTDTTTDHFAAPLEKIHLLIDYDGFKLQDSPPMSTTRYTLDILQKHYPERMKQAFLLNPPLVFRAFWALIKNFVDPVTKAKIVFCSGSQGPSLLTNHVAQVDKLEVRAYGGNAQIRPFDSDEYLHLPMDVSFDEY
jgi:CRAL/TRIO domain